MGEEPFEPRLGRMRSSGSRRGRKYLHAVLAAAARAGFPRPGTGGLSRAAASVAVRSLRACSRAGDRHAGLRARRAIVKMRLVRFGGKAFAAARAHLRYMQRDGVSREGEPGRLYSAAEDQADGKAFLDRCDGDRHQFRFHRLGRGWRPICARCSSGQSAGPCQAICARMAASAGRSDGGGADPKSDKDSCPPAPRFAHAQCCARNSCKAGAPQSFDHAVADR